VNVFRRVFGIEMKTISVTNPAYALLVTKRLLDWLRFRLCILLFGNARRSSHCIWFAFAFGLDDGVDLKVRDSSSDGGSHARDCWCLGYVTGISAVMMVKNQRREVVGLGRQIPFHSDIGNGASSGDGSLSLIIPVLYTRCLVPRQVRV